MPGSCGAETNIFKKCGVFASVLVASLAAML
jgi:hypothetical protein